MQNVERGLAARRHHGRPRVDVELHVEGSVDRSRLPDDQLARRRVHGPGALERHHRVQPRRGDLAEGQRDAPERTDPVGQRHQVLGHLGDPARVGRLDAEQLEATVGSAALGQGGIEPRAVERRAAAARRRPLLVGSEVVDVGHLDVRHRGPAGHGEREGVLRHRALCVE